MKLIALVSLLLLFSCATTMPGQDISSGSSKVSVSMEVDSTFSNEMIQMYQFSLKNNTDDWLEYDGATLGGNSNIAVLVGDRITSWIEACNIEKKVSDYNTNLLLGSLALGGAVVAGASSHQETAQIGAIISLGSITGSAVREYQKSKKKVEFQKAFPERHIFQSVVIPPRKVIQRWILVENRAGENFELLLGEDIKLKIKGWAKAQSTLRPGPYQQNYQAL
jgi:hypothetical protein